jgi:hypothetical protein
MTSANVGDAWFALRCAIHELYCGVQKLVGWVTSLTAQSERIAPFLRLVSSDCLYPDTSDPLAILIAFDSFSVKEPSRI